MAKKRKSAPPVEVPPEEESEEEEEVEEEVEGSDEEESGSESSSEEEQAEDEESKREALKGLLQPFTKEQLVSILEEAAAKSPTLVSDLIKSAQSDPIHRKIFVHGLGWDTTEETLSAAFRTYGQIEECNAVLDRATGRCKGFGFVLFKTRYGARKALRDAQKKIGSRTATCQLASAGPGGPPSDPGGRKMYVANVGPRVSVDKLRAFFAKFGEIEEGPTGLDKATGKFRGFAIILYKTAEGMKNALQEPVKEFEGCKLNCSVFVEGRGGNKSGNSGPTAALTATSGGATSLNSAGVQNFPAGFNQGLLGQTYPGSVFLGQNPGLGVFNPLLGYQAALSPAFPVAVPAALGRIAANPVPGLGVQPDVNTISPSVINAYGSQAGLGAYTGSHVGQGSAPGSAAPSARGQSGAGSSGPFPSYFRR